MYNPSHFAETRLPVMHDLVAAHPLATLVTLAPDGLVANLIPLQLRRAQGDQGTLVGHVARANPIWRDTDLSTAALAVFQGPAHYISPGWYPSKQEHGKVVPTWNYVVVQARGMLRIHDDPAWIRQQVSDLTRQQEAFRATPWSVDDAPRDYTDALLRALVGIEIPVTRWSGKWKTSQNQPPANRAGVVDGLSAQNTAEASAMAELVRKLS